MSKKVDKLREELQEAKKSNDNKDIIKKKKQIARQLTNDYLDYLREETGVDVDKDVLC